MNYLILLKRKNESLQIINLLKNHFLLFFYLVSLTIFNILVNDYSLSLLYFYDNK